MSCIVRTRVSLQHPEYILYQFGKEVNIFCTHYGIFIIFIHRLSEVSDNSGGIGVHAGIKGDPPLKLYINSKKR